MRIAAVTRTLMARRSTDAIILSHLGHVHVDRGSKRPRRPVAYAWLPLTRGRKE